MSPQGRPPGEGSPANPLCIEGDLTVYTVHELKAKLLEALAIDARLTVDLRDVGDADGAGLQLLIAAGHEAHQRGGRLSIAAAPSQVQALLQLAGLTTHFESAPSPTEDARS